MRARVLDHFAELVDNRLRSRKIGVSHAEVDDIGSTRSRAGLQTVDLFEDVWRQTPDFMKLFHFFPHGTAVIAVAMKFVGYPDRHETNFGFVAP
jgi:hypothetical protein